MNKFFYKQIMINPKISYDDKLSKMSECATASVYDHIDNYADKYKPLFLKLELNITSSWAEVMANRKIYEHFFYRTVNTVGL